MTRFFLSFSLNKKQGSKRGIIPAQALKDETNNELHYRIASSYGGEVGTAVE